jgi:hypothetical protein
VVCRACAFAALFFPVVAAALAALVACGTLVYILAFCVPVKLAPVKRSLFGFFLILLLLPPRRYVVGRSLRILVRVSIASGCLGSTSCAARFLLPQVPMI